MNGMGHPRRNGKPEVAPFPRWRFGLVSNVRVVFPPEES